MARRKLTEEEKEAKKKQQELERITQMRESEIKNLQKIIEKTGLPKSPRKVFKIGQEVVTSMSGHKWGEVVDIISEGVYEVKFEYETTKPYSSEKYIQDGQRVFGWWNLSLPTTKECTLTYKEPLKLQFFQQSVDCLIHKFFVYWGLDMNPRYQREIVWTHEQKLKLIKSIFEGLDIGKFVFISNPYSEDREFGYEILDGKQRLTTILEFYNDEWTYEGYYFSELSTYLQYKFRDLSVFVAEMRDGDATKENILEYFIRLNTTGTPMSEEHLDKVRKQLEES